MTLESMQDKRPEMHLVTSQKDAFFVNTDGNVLPFPVDIFLAKAEHVPLSTRRRSAGYAFKRARERRGITPRDLTSSFEHQTTAITLFEAGELALALPRIMDVANKKFKGEDIDKRELQNHSEEEKWLQTLTRPGLSIGRIVRLLRLYNQQTLRDFAHDAQITEKALGNIEKGHRKPKSETLNLILKASSIDPDGLPAQLVRLMGTNREPMSLKEFQTCRFGEFVSYIRQLKGLSQRGLGNLLKPRKAVGIINTLENRKTITDEELAKKIVIALGIHPKSALTDAAIAKIEKQDMLVSQDLIKKVFTGDKDGQFLFTEHLEEVNQFPRPKAESSLLKRLDALKISHEQSGNRAYMVNGMLRLLRKQKGISLRALGRSTELTYQLINHVERNKSIPLDTTVIKILNGLDYDIHDPITHYILDVMDSLDAVQSGHTVSPTVTVTLGKSKF